MRDKPMSELTDGQKEDFIRDSENISYSYRGHDPKTDKVVEHLEFRRLRGGRPREDKLKAKVRELRAKGKTFKQIKALVEQTTHDHRSEDAYRKLARTGKNPAR